MTTPQPPKQQENKGLREEKKFLKHIGSIFTDEQELIKSLINIHQNNEPIEIDPMFFKGNFYKKGLSLPKFIYDLNPQNTKCVQGDATNLPHLANSINSIILDPPFLFEKRKRKNKNYSASTHGILEGFEALEKLYKNILKEAYRILRKKGTLIFKCQDFTDTKTTMTHCLVWQWAKDIGFYAKDLAILVKPLKVFNGQTKQRHLRKVHTYFWLFKKSI